VRFNNFAGRLAGQGIGYAPGDDFRLNLLNAGLFIGDINGKSVNTGLVELSLGRNGANLGLGTGGMDASWDAVTGAFRGLEAWKVNARLWGSEEMESKAYKEALRTLYSGNGTNRAEFEAVLAGRTNIEENRGVWETESIYNEHTGIKTILLGSGAFEEGGRYGLGVVLSHESYRDGRDNGVERQQQETDRAVMGHIGTALGLMGTYGEGALSSALGEEAKQFLSAVQAYQSNSGDYKAIAALSGILGSYDSSADYWLLKKDGTLVDDGSADLHWEAVVKDTSANGNPIYKTIMSFPGMSKEESLIALLGGSTNARSMLAANNISVTDGMSATELGAAIASAMNTGAGGSLTIAYSQFKDNLNKDWHGIYQSYTANEAFYKAYTNRGLYRGDEAILQAKNMGEAISSDLEYYAVMHPYLLTEIGKIGGTGVTDPLAYLAANTSKFTYEGWGSVTLHNQIHTGLKQAFDETLANGGTLPPATNDGLWLRFQDASYNGDLYLSMHTVGMAIDFDSAHNDFYTFNNYELTNRTYNNYIARTIGMPLTGVQGWVDNQSLAAASRAYSGYVDSEVDRLSAALSQLEKQGSGYDMDRLLTRQYLLSSQLNELKEIKKELTEIEQRYRVQQLSFTLTQTFTDTMRKYFTWGGDWPKSKDYMHFEVKR
jgi:hypothetical protein